MFYVFIPGGRENKASGNFSIAFGRRAEAKDDRSLAINLQEGGGTLKSINSARRTQSPT